MSATDGVFAEQDQRIRGPHKQFGIKDLHAFQFHRPWRTVLDPPVLLGCQADLDGVVGVNTPSGLATGLFKLVQGLPGPCPQLPARSSCSQGLPIDSDGGAYQTPTERRWGRGRSVASSKVLPRDACLSFMPIPSVSWFCGRFDGARNTWRNGRRSNRGWRAPPRCSLGQQA